MGSVEAGRSGSPGLGLEEASRAEDNFEGLLWPSCRAFPDWVERRNWMMPRTPPKQDGMSQRRLIVIDDKKARVVKAFLGLGDPAQVVFDGVVIPGCWLVPRK